MPHFLVIRTLVFPRRTPRCLGKFVDKLIQRYTSNTFQYISLQKFKLAFLRVKCKIVRLQVLPDEGKRPSGLGHLNTLVNYQNKNTINDK